MISVITPVYNASRFLDKTIASVLSQKEVSEHILIDDGSEDKSWEIIKFWKEKDKRIVAVQHDDLKNHGRSATKNLGIKTAKSNLIGFLDADDFYLPNRFKYDLEILNKDVSIDGVYNAIGAFAYEDYLGDMPEFLKLTTVKEVVTSEELFKNMNPFGSKGYFSGDGLTIRKRALLNVGMFNESLEVAEDTELWCKLALKHALVPGKIETPVTMRGIHGDNVFNNNEPYLKAKKILFNSLLIWALDNNVSMSNINLIWAKRNSYVYRTTKSTQEWMSNLLFQNRLLLSYPSFMSLKITAKCYRRFLLHLMD